MLKLKKVSVGVGAMPPGGGRTYQVSTWKSINPQFILYQHLSACGLDQRHLHHHHQSQRRRNQDKAEGLRRGCVRGQIRGRGPTMWRSLCLGRR